MPRLNLERPTLASQLPSAFSHTLLLTRRTSMREAHHQLEGRHHYVWFEVVFTRSRSRALWRCAAKSKVTVKYHDRHYHSRPVLSCTYLSIHTYTMPSTMDCKYCRIYSTHSAPQHKPSSPPQNSA
ncbi:hypothetical protein T440DRAFT_301748 [Plenodomus tracheiphilus IPT5]|uniref:Uncharacterized protein n=1 Tax=Plenodomus tracheiphilus IPT5 TaxID=1408161 RepID=A0A6A7AP09_9PLEO|nr:hypothetical protein T440DRAFT_301748 [Plenodomus tracheiphilus IPT5]